MDRERIDTWCEKTILALVLAILTFSCLATGAVRPQDFLVVEWLTVAALGVWAVRFWVNPRHRLLWPPICWGVLAFALYAIGRYFTADIEYLARQELTKVLVYAALFLLVVHNLHRLEAIQIVSMVLIFLAMAVALYALYQFLADSAYVWHFVRPDIYRKRGSGTYICPNHMAGFLEMILPLALAYTLTGRFKHLTKILLGYAALMIFAGIVVSISRGGWVATGAALVLLFLFMLRQRGYRLQSIVALVALVGLAAAFISRVEFSHNRKEALTGASQAEDFRFRLWMPAWEMWQEHKLWGVGPDHFNDRFRQYRPSNNEVQGRPGRVHNDYLNALVDWGLAGAILVAVPWLLLLYGIVSSWKYLQRTPNDLTSKRSNKSSFVLGAACGLAAILVHSLFDFNMHIPANAMVAVTLMALITGHFRFATERFWVTLHLPLRTAVTVILLAGLTFLGREAWRGNRELSWLARANEAPDYSPGQISALEQAYAADSRNGDTAYRIGEAWRIISWQGESNYKETAEKALSWFERAMRLNRWDPYSRLRYGMCLDWIGRTDEAGRYFEQAYLLDPNGHYVVAHVGWHHIQLKDYLSARKWFEKSLYLYWEDNLIARTYLALIDQRLAEEPRAN